MTDQSRSIGFKKPLPPFQVEIPSRSIRVAQVVSPPNGVIRGLIATRFTDQQSPTDFSCDRSSGVAFRLAKLFGETENRLRQIRESRDTVQLPGDR